MKHRVLVPAFRRARDSRAVPGPEGEPECVPFGDALFGRLELRQTRRFRPTFELRSERGVHIVLGTAGTWGRRWTARGAQHRWDLHLRWLGAVDVTEEGSDVTLLEFRPGWWRNGRIETATGETLLWRMVGLRHHELATEDGSALIALRHRGWFRVTTEVALSDAARARTDLPALVCLTATLLLAARRHAT